MSVRLTTWAWGVDVPATEKLVLLALCDHANDEDYQCWPSIAHLASKTGASERTVQRALRALEELALISRQQRRRQVTLYRIQIDQPQGRQNDTPRSKGCQNDAQGVTNCRPEGDKLTPGTVSEPSMEERVSGARIRKVIEQQGFDWQQVMTASTGRLIREWTQAGLTEGELHEAIALATEQAKGKPDSPMYYQWAVRSVLQKRIAPDGAGAKGGTATDSANGRGKGRTPEMIHGLDEKDYGAGADQATPEWLRNE